MSNCSIFPISFGELKTGDTVYIVKKERTKSSVKSKSYIGTVSYSGDNVTHVCPAAYKDIQITYDKDETINIVEIEPEKTKHVIANYDIDKSCISELFIFTNVLEIKNTILDMYQHYVEPFSKALAEFSDEIPELKFEIVEKNEDNSSLKETVKKYVDKAYKKIKSSGHF